MSRTHSTTATPLEGFSVFQSELGAQLQFLPALGTPELDSLIDAFLLGPASMKDKRATVVMDFCEYAKRTGQNFKYYPVYQSAAATTTDSPASSAAMYDSGYASSFNASPAVSDATAFWNVFSPSSATQTKQPSPSSSQRKSSVASSSRAAAKDFSHIPGMKIMTKDGQDVTNSASRGCKTKEQRDHAHLMRIIKACDSCRRKKIRCDPSHRKRSASSQAQSPPSKKTRKAAAEAPPPVFNESEAAAAAAAAASSAPFHLAPTPAFPAEDLLFTDPFVEESWESFVNFDDDFSGLPFDYNFQLDAENYFSPSSGSSSSLSPSQQPFTPAPPGPSPVDVYSGSLFPEPDGQEEAQLPYLSSGLHGANYIDFNLFSPPANFLDEEPLQLQTTKTSRLKKAAGVPGLSLPDTQAGQKHTTDASASCGLSSDQSSASPAAVESYFCGCTEDQQQRRQSVAVPEPGWRVPGDRPGRYGEQAHGGQHVGSLQFGDDQRLQTNGNHHHYSLQSAHSPTSLLAAAATSQPGSPLGLAASAPATSRPQQYCRSSDHHSPLVSSSCRPTLTTTGSNIQMSVMMDHAVVTSTTRSVATSQAKGHQQPQDKGCGQDGLSPTASSSSSPASSCFSPLLSSSSSSTSSSSTPASSVSALQTVSPALPGAYYNAAAPSPGAHHRVRVAIRSSEDEQDDRSHGDGQPTASGREDHFRDHLRDYHKEDIPKRGSHRSITRGAALPDPVTSGSLPSSTPEYYRVSREGKLQLTAPSDSTVLRVRRRRSSSSSSSHTVSMSIQSSSSTGSTALVAPPPPSSLHPAPIPSLPASAVGLGHSHYSAHGGSRHGSSLSSSQPGEQPQQSSSGIFGSAGAIGDDIAGLAALVLTAALLSTLPVRPLVDGLRSAPAAAVVVLGLVSLLASAYLISQSLPSGIVSDLLFSKMPAAALALAPVGIRHHTFESSSSSSSPSSPSAKAVSMVRETVDNVQFKVRRAAECVSDLRCALARRFAGPTSPGSAVVGRPLTQ